MPDAMSDQTERAERRVYHAQFILYLAVMPVVTLFASTATAGALGDHDVRALALAHPFRIVGALAYASLFLISAWMLGRRQRAGAMIAATLFALMLVGSMQGERLSLFSLMFALAGLVLIARAWRAIEPIPASVA